MWLPRRAVPGFMGIGDESPHTCSLSLSEPIRTKQVREVLTTVQYYCPRPTIGDYLI